MENWNVKIENLLWELNRIAVDYDKYEHGLPMHTDRELNAMCAAVERFMKSDNVPLLPVGAKVVCNGDIDVIVKHVEQGSENYAMGYRYELKEHGTQSTDNVQSSTGNGDKAIAVLKKLVESFPEFDTDEQINGSDAVDTLAGMWDEIKEAIQ